MSIQISKSNIMVSDSSSVCMKFFVTKRDSDWLTPRRLRVDLLIMLYKNTELTKKKKNVYFPLKFLTINTTKFLSCTQKRLEGKHYIHKLIYLCKNFQMTCSQHFLKFSRTLRIFYRFDYGECSGPFWCFAFITITNSHLHF